MKTSSAPRAVLGMTIVELLVSFMIFLMMIGALVALTSRSLDSWQEGEKRKSVYDRAQVVLDMVARDIRNTYAENEIITDGRRELLPPLFAGDYDRLRRQRIRFVRTGNPNVMRARGGSGQGGTRNSRNRGPRWRVASTEYTDLFEVAYILDPDPKNAVLLRGVRRFDRDPRYTILDPGGYQNPGDQALTDTFQAVESGVIYLGFKYWTQVTTTWDASQPPKRVSKRSRQKSGPSLRWDSTRREDRHFYFYRGRPDQQNPDFVYPEIVQITVTIETTEPELHNIRVATSVDTKNRTILLTHTRGLPNAGSVLIEGEWISYTDISSTALLNCARHQRATKPAGHAAGAPVRFGETFTTDVRIATYREAAEP